MLEEELLVEVEMTEVVDSVVADFYIRHYALLYAAPSLILKLSWCSSHLIQSQHKVNNILG